MFGRSSDVNMVAKRTLIFDIKV